MQCGSKLALQTFFEGEKMREATMCNDDDDYDDDDEDDEEVSMVVQRRCRH